MGQELNPRLLPKALQSVVGELVYCNCFNNTCSNRRPRRDSSLHQVPSTGLLNHL